MRRYVLVVSAEIGLMLSWLLGAGILVFIPWAWVQWRLASGDDAEMWQEWLSTVTDGWEV